MGFSRRELAYQVLIKDPKSLWLALSGVFAAWLIPTYLSKTPETQILWAGLTLQVAGLFSVAWGLMIVRKLFGRPTIFQMIAGWWRRVKWISNPPSPHVLEVQGAVAETYAGTASLSLGWSDDWPDDRKLNWLRGRYDDLQRKLDATAKTLRKSDETLDEKISSERQERIAKTGEIDQKLEGLAVGGLRLEFVGVVWLLFGVVLTAIPGLF